MARILILDDNEILFGAPEDYMVDPRDFRTDQVVQVATPDLFWQEYTDGPWDEVWLDHDLGDPYASGRDVTKRLAEMGHDGRSFTETFIVISMNNVAARAMISDLLRYTDARVGYFPISSLDCYGVSRGLPFARDSVLRRN